jgi:flagellar protein FlaG
MEVRSIGQGGQTSFDNISTKEEKAKPIESQVAKTPNVATTKMQEKDSTQNHEVDVQKNPISEKELKEALDKLSKFVEDDNTKIEYQFHSKFSNDLMIKIIDKATKEVILEVPPKKILDLVAKMMEMVGILFDKKA